MDGSVVLKRKDSLNLSANSAPRGIPNILPRGVPNINNTNTITRKANNMTKINTNLFANNTNTITRKRRLGKDKAAA